jgi:hypothetical protein
MSYLSLEEAKTFLFPRGSAPADLNAFILAELAAVDNIIEAKCGRVFTTGTASEIRYFDGTGKDFLCPDDLLTITKLEYCSDSTWTEIPSGDYVLYPYNS